MNNTPTYKFWVYPFLVMLLFLFSCKSQLSSVSYFGAQPYLNFDKVKVSLSINGEHHKFKGYINTIKDTSVCFRFWGLLGYELGRGQIDDNFVFFNAITNTTNTNLKQQMEGATGLVLNKQVIFPFLFGDITSLSKALFQLNKDIMSINIVGKNELEVYHKVSQQTITIKYKFVNSIPQTIKIIQKRFQDNFELNLEIVEISRDKKNCRFKL